MNDENTALQPENAGSQRSVLLLADMDPAQTKSDLRLIRKAQREGWKISPKVKRIIARRLVGIVQKTEVEVVTKDGMAHVDGPADTNAIAAARVLVAMNGQDQVDDHKGTPDEVHHTHDIGIESMRQMMMSDPTYVEFLRQQAEREDAVVIEGRTVPDHDSNSIPAESDD